MTQQTADSGGSVYAELVVELVDAEDARRTSLESRAGTVITVSGSLVSLLLAIAALVTKAQTFVLPGDARDVLVVAVLAFVLSALLAIATYVPQAARITDPVELARTLPGLWNGTDSDAALKRVTATRLQQLTSAQTVNDRKAWVLLGAVGAQVLAIALVAVAVLIIL